MSPVAAPVSPRTAVCPRILVVDDEPDLIDLMDHVVGRDLQGRFFAAHSLEEAKQILASQAIELLVIDVHLPDGDGMSLLPLLRRHQPQASAIVITGSPSVDGAISALREGALDFLPKPFNADALIGHMRRALERQAIQARTERRLVRLRDAVRRLNEARKVVSKKVDLLCNDLIVAYGDLAKQLDGVRTQEGFRKYLQQAKDLEQMLCHAMDWILRQLGYCNIAVWLAAEEQDFQLGAYMKYTIAGEEDLVNAMKLGLVGKVAREGFANLTPDEAQDYLTPAELDYLADQHILATNCTYLGDSLAVIVLFRNSDAPFKDEDAEVLEAISPVFAGALASMVRRSGGNPEPGGDGPFADDEREENKADSDWWKRGETPPF